VADWNLAAMLRYIWNIFARAGSLWVAWVKEYLLKGKNLWQLKYLKVVLGVGGWKYLVRNFLRYGWWHPDGPGY
jgi:hypothetical protein